MKNGIRKKIVDQNLEGRAPVAPPPGFATDLLWFNFWYTYNINSLIITREEVRATCKVDSLFDHGFLDDLLTGEDDHPSFPDLKAEDVAILLGPLWKYELRTVVHAFNEEVQLWDRGCFSNIINCSFNYTITMRTDAWNQMKWEESWFEKFRCINVWNITNRKFE